MLKKINKLVVATKNTGKLGEMAELLEPMGIKAISQLELGCDEDTLEDGTTFEENALIKARAVAKYTGMAAIADDSGLCVDALDGAPGIYSARYAGADASDEDRINKLLEELKDLPEESRGAHFVSALAFVSPEGESFSVRGECYGRILTERRGEGGFGYDPVFFHFGTKSSFGELQSSVKDAVSHRAMAMVKFEEKLKELGLL